jgi:anti-sigma-K factor RskA
MSDDIHALSGAYAVDALDDVERARFERHLSGCSACQAEVAGLTATAGELAMTVEQAPPPGLRAKVMADIGRVRPLPPLGAPGDAHTRTSVTAAREAVTHDERPEDGAAPGEPADASATSGSSQGSGSSGGSGGPGEAPESSGQAAPIPFLTRRRRLWRGLVAASAATLLAIGGFTAWRAATYDPNQAVADQVLAAPDATRSTKRFPDGSTATVVRSDDLGKAVIVTSGMAAPPSGKVYQLWLQEPNGHFASAGLMPEGPDQVVVLTGDARNATGAGITVEPSGGSDQPTSDPIALFSFA